MKFFSYKNKVVLLSVVPLLIAIIIIAFINIKKTQELGVAQSQIFEAEILQSKKDEMRNYMALAYTAIKDIYENPSKNTKDAKKLVSQILKKMEFGDDGYFYVYDYNGVNIAHPRKPELEGEDLYNLQDENGKYLIQGLINKAKAGGGYTYYLWDKPSGGKSVAKIGYSIGLDKWEWMIGTGLYIDDIEKGLAKIESRVNKTTQETLLFTSIIMGASVLMIGLTGLLVNISEIKLANIKIKEITRKTILFQENDRKRISRELHDGINQLLVSIRYKLEAALGKLDSENLRVAQLLQEADNALSLTVNEVRKISKDLRPILLDDFGLLAAIKNLAKDLYERTNIKVSINVDGSPDKLSKTMETAIYRITQEAFTNTAKHAVGANLIELFLEFKENALNIIISNNGTGFDSVKSLEKTTL